MILVIAPWSRFWDRNFFTALVPALAAVMPSAYVRGAVSGIGIITVVAGLAELAAALGSRRQNTVPPTHPTFSSRP